MDIEKLVRKINVTPDAQMDKKTLNDILKAQERTKKLTSADFQPNIRRIIMKTRITKLAAAAVIMLAVILVINQLGGSIDFTSTAWAKVENSIARADYVHCYYFKSRGNNFIKHFEAWYSYGKLVTQGYKGSMTYDDGQIQQTFDEQGRRIAKEESLLVNGNTFLDVFTLGLLSDKDGQFSQQIPINVGDDFLVYEFDPPSEESEWLESILITVGKSSLLPVQMKVYHRDGDYDLVMFDYEAPEKPSEFFEPPIIKLPNGSGEVVLDGKEVMIDIVDAPGIKTAIARLHSKSSEGNKPSFSLDITFITEEGFRSRKGDFIRLGVNEAKQCGVGSSTGDFDNWPDGKYRNIRFSPLLKSTDKENIYIVEINCWVLTEGN